MTDPITAVAWFKAAFHLLALATCLHAWRAAASVGEPAQVAWGWLAGSLLTLALVLDSLVPWVALLLDSLRELAQVDGWYRWRRPLQAGVLVAAGLGLLVGAPSVLRACRHRLSPPGRIAWLALALQALLLLTRTVSLHQTDGLLRLRMAGLPAYAWLDGLGTMAVVVGAWLDARSRSPAGLTPHHRSDRAPVALRQWPGGNFSEDGDV